MSDSFLRVINHSSRLIMTRLNVRKLNTSLIVKIYVWFNKPYCIKLQAHLHRDETAIQPASGRQAIYLSRLTCITYMWADILNSSRTYYDWAILILSPLQFIQPPKTVHPYLHHTIYCVLIHRCIVPFHSPLIVISLFSYIVKHLAQSAPHGVTTAFGPT
jgi:hypothetical protein